jgi:hypothetical protein
MSPALLDVFTDNYFTPESVSLGRLVLNKKAPNEDFLPLPEKAKLNKSDIEPSLFEGVHVTSKNDSGCKIDFAATKIATFHHENSSKPPSDAKLTNDVTTTKVIVYKLLNSGNIFDKITKDDESKVWIEKNMVRSNIYMVSGVQTVFDAKVVKGEDGKSETGGGLQILLSELLPGASFPGQELLDFKFSGKTWDNQGTLVTFMSPGERIVGIQYRRLGFRPFHSKTLGDAALKEGKWWKRLTSDDKTRGKEEEDAIEVCFGDFNKADIDKENEEEEDDDNTDWKVQEFRKAEENEVVAIFSKRTESNTKD